MKKLTVVLLVLLVALPTATVAIAGCGGLSPEQAREQFNTDMQNLKTALSAFLNPATYASTDSIESAADDVKKEFNSVVSSAKEVKNVSTSTLQEAWDELEKSVKNLSSDQSLTQKADAIQSAANDFLKARQEVFSESSSP